MKSSICILIADGYELARDGLHVLLEQFDDIDVVGEAFSESDLLQKNESGGISSALFIIIT